MFAAYLSFFNLKLKILHFRYVLLSLPLCQIVAYNRVVMNKAYFHTVFYVI